jgi:hypothetical protein
MSLCKKPIWLRRNRQSSRYHACHSFNCRSGARERRSAAFHIARRFTKAILAWSQDVAAFLCFHHGLSCAEACRKRCSPQALSILIVLRYNHETAGCDHPVWRRIRPEAPLAIRAETPCLALGSPRLQAGASAGFGSHDFGSPMPTCACMSAAVPAFDKMQQIIAEGTASLPRLGACHGGHPAQNCGGTRLRSNKLTRG